MLWTHLVDPERGPNECVARTKFGVPELVNSAFGPNGWTE